MEQGALAAAASQHKMGWGEIKTVDSKSRNFGGLYDIETGKV